MKEFIAEPAGAPGLGGRGCIQAEPHDFELVFSRFRRADESEGTEPPKS
jgi:hypothetical protein